MTDHRRARFQRREINLRAGAGHDPHRAPQRGGSAPRVGDRASKTHPPIWL
ncbi:MAG: hypothetical protein GVY30_07520 [Chloroflexi bacterium]|nr:hypothetical protein [Chloroflexota bacterium]